MTTWQPRLETNQEDECHQQSYLVCPPHHQVRENCNPSDGAKESDREELPGSLQDNQKGECQYCPLWWSDSPRLKPPLPLPWFLPHFLLLHWISNQKMLPAPNQTGRGKFILGNWNCGSWMVVELGKKATFFYHFLHPSFPPFPTSLFETGSHSPG